jgi:hypothetical protein
MRDKRWRLRSEIARKCHTVGEARTHTQKEGGIAPQALKYVLRQCRVDAKHLPLSTDPSSSSTEGNLHSSNRKEGKEATTGRNLKPRAKPEESVCGTAARQTYPDSMLTWSRRRRVARERKGCVMYRIMHDSPGHQSMQIVTCPGRFQTLRIGTSSSGSTGLEFVILLTAVVITPA